MAFEVTMPQMGADMTEGTLLKWLKQVGDHVERGDIIAEIETDKATVELEAYESGELLKLVVGEGEAAPVGEVIALIGEASEAVADSPRKPAAENPPRRVVEKEPAKEPVTAGASTGQSTGDAPPASPLEEAESFPEPPAPEKEPEFDRPTPSTTQPPATSSSGSNGRVRISPVARRIANQSGVDVTMLKGSGPDGRILRRDVEAAIEAGERPAAAAPVAGAPAAPREAATPERASGAKGAEQPMPTERPRAPQGQAAPAGMSKMRQAIAHRMTLSKQTQPHYYLTVDVDMTAAMAFRETLNASASEQQRVSVNDLIVKACAIALERHPKFNAAYTDAGLVMHERINICIGIALDEGLIAPAILDTQTKSLGRIAMEAKDLIARAKISKLRADEYGDGTFTITNLGAYGVETLIGIINPPQAAILGVGSVMDQPVARDGQVVVAKVMKIALSADHRVSDGAEGARFIKELQGLLEAPVSMAL